MLVNIYLPCVSPLFEATMVCAKALAVQQQLQQCEALLREALTLLGLSRCLPGTHAKVYLLLAHTLRNSAMLGAAGHAWRSAALARGSSFGGSGCGNGQLAAMLSGAAEEEGTGAQQHAQQLLQEAQQLLAKALAATMSGGGSHSLQRDCLLELAAVALAEQPQQPQRVVATLAAAHATTTRQRRLELGSHTLGPVAVGGLPAWLVEQLHGQEAAAQCVPPAGSAARVGGSAAGAKQQEQPAAAPAAAVPDELLGRLALTAFAQLASAPLQQLGLEERGRTAAQAHCLLSVLKAACPAFAAECCWPHAPPLPAATHLIAPGECRCVCVCGGGLHAAPASCLPAPSGLAGLLQPT